MTVRQRYTPDQRKKMIVNAAVTIAVQKGIEFVTLASVAEACPTTTAEATVRHYYPNVSVLMAAIVEASPELKKSAEAFGYSV